MRVTRCSVSSEIAGASLGLRPPRRAARAGKADQGMDRVAGASWLSSRAGRGTAAL